MKLSLEYLDKQWNLTFKKGLQWKACILAPNTDILEVKIPLQLTQNSLATGRILIYNKLVQTHILFFFKALTIQNLKELCYADMHLSFKKSQTQSQTKQTKTPSNFWVSVDCI